MSLTPSSRHNQCPVCENTSGKCRQSTEDTDYWQCMTYADVKKGQVISGYIRWRCVGHTRNQMWATFKPDESGQGYLFQREAGSFSTLAELEQRLEWMRENQRRQGKKDKDIVVTLHFDPSSRLLRPPEGINRQQDTKGYEKMGGES